MISQNCPKCLSKRVRRGYRPTPLWSKILFRYNLLCDNCNWEFVGFAVPGTVTAKPTKSPKKKPVNKINESLNNQTANNSISNLPKEPEENLGSLESPKEPAESSVSIENSQKEPAENLVSIESQKEPETSLAARENLAELSVKDVKKKRNVKRKSRID